MPLEVQIQSLLDLQNRLQFIRQSPQSLLKAPFPHELPLSNLSPAKEFHVLKEFEETLCSDPVQEALRIASESEKADKSDLNPNGRRENRKRRLVIVSSYADLKNNNNNSVSRRPPSPESPQPYIAPESKSASLFPVIPENDMLPLKIHDLEAYIRDFNASSPSRLHLWKSTRSSGSRRLDNPVVLRLTIRDVLVAYITFGYTLDNPTLIVESVTCFGPRERVRFNVCLLDCSRLTLHQKYPHSRSDYLVYQNLSQQLATMVQSHPRVSAQSLMVRSNMRVDPEEPEAQRQCLPPEPAIVVRRHMRGPLHELREGVILRRTCTAGGSRLVRK